VTLSLPSVVIVQCLMNVSFCCCNAALTEATQVAWVTQQSLLLLLLLLLPNLL
jgi:hypothetical protein